jgi:phosphoserine phosphatase RsbU/P
VASTKRSVLIVDDNPDILTSLSLLLKLNFGRIDTELSPEFIPERLRGFAYDVILLDMNFTRDTTSGVEGFQWLETIRRLDPDLPVVLFTGYGDVETAVEAIRCGAHDFVLKPWDNEKLVRTLLAACRDVGSAGEPPDRPDSEIEKDLLLARQVQLRLLPQAGPHLPRLDYTGYCQPARHAGGDYYDFIVAGEGRLGIALADVSGKGVAAALLMASLQGRLQSIVGTSPDPDAVLHQLNRDFFQMTETNRFASMVYGVIDARTGIFNFTNAGHLPLLLLRSGAVELLKPCDPVLGVFPEATFTRTSLQLKAGDILLLYTDGLTEAPSPDGEEFGIDRVSELLMSHPDLKAVELRDVLLRELREFTGAHPHDDLTLIIIRVLE